jgi:hypothetical protein
MRNKTIVFTSAIVMALLFALAMGAGALLAEENATDSAPTLINYQGQLSDSGGQPVSGPVSLQFKLYDASSGGTMLWTETHSGVPVDGGAFSVMLGENTPLTDSLFSSSSRYLEIGVDTANGSNYTTMPRQRLASVPYALQANSVPWSGLSGMPAGFADGVDDGGADYENVVIVAKSGGDYTTISDAMSSISPSSSSRYLVWVGPGIYMEQVTVKPYVHLRGAGMYTTYIDSTSSGNQNTSSSATVILPANAQLSNMTVKNSSTSNDGVAVFVDQGNSSTLVRNVYAKTTESGGDRHVAFYLKSGAPTLRDVKGKTSGGSVGNWTIFNSVSAPMIDGATLTAEGNSSANALRLNGGNPMIQNSTLYATSASAAYAIEGTGAGTHTVRIDHSSIDGEDFSVRLSSGNYTVYIGASRVVGNPNAFSGTIRCAQSYDGSYTDLNSSCN